MLRTGSELRRYGADTRIRRCFNCSPTVVPKLYNGPLLFSSKLRLLMGDLVPHLIRGSLGPFESSTQRTSRSVQPFSQGSRSSQTDRPTDDATSATIGRTYIGSLVLRCGLIIIMVMHNFGSRVRFSPKINLPCSDNGININARG